MLPAVLLLATQNPNLGSFPDPRTPMPAKGEWKDPGYLKIVWIQSPNFGERPHGIADVTTIVLHSTVDPTLEETTDVFQSKAREVSAHFTVGKDGSIVQNVSTFKRAWHAGKSWDAEGRNNVNDYSIGIEMVNLDDGKDPYTDAQIQAVCGLIAEMKRRFPIKQIVSHEYIAQPQGRKVDPKGFPWERLKYLGLPMYFGQTNPNKAPKP